MKFHHLMLRQLTIKVFWKVALLTTQPPPAGDSFSKKDELQGL